MVDPAGVVIQSASERPAGIPLIDIGGASADSPAFKAVVEVLLALPDSMLATVESATAQTKDDVTFVLAGVGQRVVWGSADRSALKARVLAGTHRHPGPARTGGVRRDGAAESGAASGWLRIDPTSRHAGALAAVAGPAR